jgi:ABC-type amino acid transport system permease subunit
LATAYRELANASGRFLLLGLAVSAFYLAMSLPMAHLARLLEQRLRNRATERMVETEATA